MPSRAPDAGGEAASNDMVRNERLKLFANFVNAIGLGLIALAVLRPIIETGSGSYGVIALWSVGALVLHGVAHYILGYLQEGDRV